MSRNIALRLLEHPDKEEIIAKLCSNAPINDIVEWLDAKYSENEKKFKLSKGFLVNFQKNYLDFYNIIREDASSIKKLSAEEELKEEIQGSTTYHKALERYVNSEVDIKLIVKRLVATIETRAAQVFDQIQEDPRNVRMDRTLVEWFNTLITVLEKYDTILNGTPDNINIQNNINIQVIDEHINVVYNVIKEILEKLDYDTSLLFIEMFNEKMKSIESTKQPLPLDERILEAKVLKENVVEELKNQ